MKPETIARRAAEREAEELAKRSRFLENYREASAIFPVPSEPPEASHYFAEFPDGRAVGIGVNGWREE